MGEPQPGLPFDTILVLRASGAVRLSVDELRAIPLRERVQLLLEERVQFLRQGARVDAKLALAALYARRA